MSDLETRLRSLRPAPAPEDLWTRIRGTAPSRKARRPWILSGVAAAAAVWLIVFLSRPATQRPAGEGDAVIAGMADRLAKADTFVKAMDTMVYEPDMFGSAKATYSPAKRLGSDASRLSQIQDGKWKVVSDYVKPAP